MMSNFLPRLLEVLRRATRLLGAKKLGGLKPLIDTTPSTQEHEMLGMSATTALESKRTLSSNLQDGSKHLSETAPRVPPLKTQENVQRPVKAMAAKAGNKKSKKTESQSQRPLETPEKLEVQACKSEHLSEGSIPLPQMASQTLLLDNLLMSAEKRRHLLAMKTLSAEQLRYLEELLTRVEPNPSLDLLLKFDAASSSSAPYAKADSDNAMLSD